MVRTALFGKPIFELVYTYRLAAGNAVQGRVLLLLLLSLFSVERLGKQGPLFNQSSYILGYYSMCYYLRTDFQLPTWSLPPD